MDADTARKERRTGRISGTQMNADGRRYGGKGGRKGFWDADTGEATERVTGGQPGASGTLALLSRHLSPDTRHPAPRVSKRPCLAFPVGLKGFVGEPVKNVF